ncbi:hypothetical protein NMY22_g10348 [Coprinellus aureogranulatus]|nr:hypothetical protein NMY22_g10348 [Coprinellus aureogranulatus]
MERTTLLLKPTLALFLQRNQEAFSRQTQSTSLLEEPNFHLHPHILPSFRLRILAPFTRPTLRGEKP